MREGMAQLMRHCFGHVQLLQAASLGEACICLGGQTGIDLVLLDLNLRDSTGVDSVRRLRRAAPQARVVVLSAESDSDTVRSAIAAGACGFIPKTARRGVIETALQQVLAGQTYLPSGLLQVAPPGSPWGYRATPLPQQQPFLSPSPARPAPASSGRLTPLRPQATELLVHQIGLAPRQVDVLRLMLEGGSNKLIARELALAESTVKSHSIAIFRKLNVSSRAEVMAHASRIGLYRLLGRHGGGEGGHGEPPA